MKLKSDQNSVSHFLFLAVNTLAHARFSLILLRKHIAKNVLTNIWNIVNGNNLSKNLWRLNQFVPNAPFLYSLKTSESRKVSDVFRGERKDALGTNGLIIKPTKQIVSFLAGDYDNIEY